MNKLAGASLAMIMILASGCTSIGHQSGQYGVQANTNGEVGSLQGEAKSHHLLMGLFNWGDSGVATAANNSGGKYIRTVDQGKFCFLGIYGSKTTKVTTENTPPAAE